jgi:hypothetical protein
MRSIAIAVRRAIGRALRALHTDAGAHLDPERLTVTVGQLSPIAIDFRSDSFGDAGSITFLHGSDGEPDADADSAFPFAVTVSSDDTHASTITGASYAGHSYTFAEPDAEPDADSDARPDSDTRWSSPGRLR